MAGARRSIEPKLGSINADASLLFYLIRFSNEAVHLISCRGHFRTAENKSLAQASEGCCLYFSWSGSRNIQEDLFVLQALPILSILSKHWQGTRPKSFNRIQAHFQMNLRVHRTRAICVWVSSVFSPLRVTQRSARLSHWDQG